MKRLIFIPLLLISLILSATNYYVKTGGSDAANGLSNGTAWATISKVNTIWAAGTFAPGDSILFNRGDTFIGVITAKESGTAGNLIVIGAYGTGAKPIITGFTDISGSWTNYSGNIYRKAVTTSSDMRYLTIGGVNTLMGRYPNTGRNIVTTGGSNTSLIDATNLTQADDYWNGAEIVVRPNAYSHERLKVLDFVQSTRKITYTTTAVYTNTAGYGYFMQNSIRCLTDNGDWCWDGSYVYMYYGSDPSALTIKAATYDYGIDINNYDYIGVANVRVEGYNVAGIRNRDGDYNTITGTTASRCVTGIYNYNADYVTISTDSVHYCGWYGISLSQCNNGTVDSNVVLYIGLDGGFGYRGMEGISVTSANFTNVSKNDVNHIGYDGIRLSIANNCIIEKNRVRDYCYLIDDGGGIYTSYMNVTRITDNYPEALPYVGNTIRYNFVEGGDGTVSKADSPEGATGIYYNYGIYLDYETQHVYVNNNLVAGNNGNLYANSGQYDKWEYNMATKSRGSVLHISYGSMEIYLGDGGSDPDYDTVKYNKLVVNYRTENDIANWAIRGGTLQTHNYFDYNYLLLPTGNKAGYSNYVAALPGYNTLAAWLANALTGANETGDAKLWTASYSHTTKDQFVDYAYNFTGGAASYPFTVGWTYYDVTDGSEVSVLSMPAYTGAILYRINDTDLPPLASVQTHVIDSTSYITAITAIGGGTVTVDEGASVTDRGVCWGTSTNPTIAGSHASSGSGLGSYTVTLTGLKGNTLYYVRAYATNTTGTTYGVNTTFTTPVYSTVVNGVGKAYVSGGKILIIK